MPVLRKYLLVLNILFLTSGIRAQFKLKVVFKDLTDLKAYSYEENSRTKLQAEKETDQLIRKLRTDGYLLASADSIAAYNDSMKVWLLAGKKIKQFKIEKGDLSGDLISKLHLQDLFNGRTITTPEVLEIHTKKILQYYENNGYPFVSVKYDSLKIRNDSVTLQLHLKKGKLIKIDSIQVYGNSSTNKKFILRYLSLREGMLYNESKIRRINDELKQLPFLETNRSAEIQFTDKKNKLIVFANKKNASQFDGIVGLLPDATTKKTVVTGDVKLKVINGVFRSGETFDLQWRRLQTQTQDFKGKVIYPFLFGTPFGTDYSLKIYRKDTTFVDINNSAGLQYYFSGLDFIRVFYKQRNSNLISTGGLALLTELPEYADMTTRSYGLGINLDRTDYRFNPRKGLSLSANIQTGNRNINRNPKINETLYSNILLLTTQQQGEIDLHAYLPIVKNNIIHFAIQAATVFGNSTIYRNELFRIGGIRTLRGVDEESIYASSYVIPTLEYRFLFSKNSNLLLFAEGAWYENVANGKYVKDTPVSLGAGINFETKAGILGLNYALGNQFGNGFDVRNGKIHIGLSALF